MNFLQLAVKTRQECGASGTGPAGVTNQTGESKRIVDWVADAWTEIQNRHISQWRWLRKDFSFNTVVGQTRYAYGAVTDVEAAALISRFNNWWWEDEDGVPQVLIYKQSEGIATQRRLIAIPLSSFKYLFGIGSPANQQPAYVSVDEQKRILIGPPCDDVYVVTGQYQRGAQILADNADIPECPTEHHLLVVYEAMKKYAGYEAASEVWARAVALADPAMRRLEHDQLPEFSLAPPLA